MSKEMRKKGRLLALGFLGLTLSVVLSAATAWSQTQQEPTDWPTTQQGTGRQGAGDQGGQRQRAEELRKAMQDSQELIRLMFGIVELEKNKNLAVTRQQAGKLLPLVEELHNSKALDSLSMSGTFGNVRWQGAGSQGGSGQNMSQQERARLQKEQEERTAAQRTAGKVVVRVLEQFEKILTPKQLGAIDAMEIKALEGMGGQGVPRNQSGSGQGGGGQGGGFAMGGFGPGGGSQISQAEIEKMRRQAEERRKQFEAEFQKMVKQFNKVIETKSGKKMKLKK